MAEYEEVPDADKLDDDEIPIGALILAHQAVSIYLHPSLSTDPHWFDKIEHAFKMWKTGEFVPPDSRKPAGQFSYDNYADFIQHIKSTGGSKSRKVLKRRATQHVATVKSLSRDTWNMIFTEAASHISKGKKRKRSQSASSCGSEVVEDLIQEDDSYEEVVLESD